MTLGLTYSKEAVDVEQIELLCLEFVSRPSLQVLLEERIAKVTRRNSSKPPIYALYFVLNVCRHRWEELYPYGTTNGRMQAGNAIASEFFDLPTLIARRERFPEGRLEPAYILQTSAHEKGWMEP